MDILNYENRRLLDVVDESDKVIDSISRIQVHRLGLLHREIHVWMLDNNNNIIFQKRGLNRWQAGLLDATVGGHVDKGEDYLKAAIREIKEETGLKILRSDLIFITKLRSLETSNDPWGQKNNFFRKLYIYKPTVDYKKLKKEPGVPGVSFQKLSLAFLSNISENELSLFPPFLLNEELPLVLEYLKNNAATDY